MRALRRRRLLAAGLAVVAATASLVAPSLAQTVEPSDYLHLVGSLHNHSAYSDGWPGTTPETYFDRGKKARLAFMGSGEHSDNTEIPVTFSEGCLEGPAGCVAADGELRKWEATQRYADEYSVDGQYTAFRGFEWSSDRFGHINVYFSKNYTNAKVDGGYAVMDTFWKWFNTPAGLGGGADGLGTFNHPGADQLHDSDPTQNWNDFEYVPEADHRMVGIEVYNRTSDYGTTDPGNAPDEGYYVRALDKGWHVGAIGAEDMHGNPGQPEHASPELAKTVILATENSKDAIRSAMLARRFYATRFNHGLRLDFTVDGEPMGSRLVRQTGEQMRIQATTNEPGVDVQIVTSGGKVIPLDETKTGTTVAASADERYYFMRVLKDGEYIAYSSPVWVTTAPQPRQGEWLAGDLHVHTCYSHDAYCPPNDDNTGPDEFYTLSGNVNERFTEAAVRGLDYLAITDHNDVRSSNDPAFGSHGVLGIPGYENSLNGHAQMLGATKLYDAGKEEAADVNAMADELRADGGVFQANHPAERLTEALDESCSDTSDLDWDYGFEVPVDTVEIWNIGHHYQPPAPSGSSNEDAITYWECWLNRRARVGATGGSDSHWLSTAAVQGPGNPTTWVFARERTTSAVLEAIKEGRTSVSAAPPVAGGSRVELEADGDGDGIYEAVVGDEVAPGSAMRVRSSGLATGLVEVRANSETILEGEPLAPGGTIEFTSPEAEGWVRATLYAPDAEEQRTQGCDPIVGSETTYCRNQIAVLALTSAIYLESPPEATQLTYVGPRRVRGGEVPVAALLETEDGDPIAGRKLTFTNRGNEAHAETDASGVARTTLAMPDHGTSQIVEVHFAGDEQYRESHTSATLTWTRAKRRRT